MMPTTTNANATANDRSERKSLAQLLDKFDKMIDGLDAAIAEAVGDAVRSAVADAVSQAVRTAVLELAAYSDLNATLNAAPVAPGTNTSGPRRSAFRRAVDGLAAALSWLLAGLKKVGRAALAPPLLAAKLLGRLANAAWRCPGEAALAAATGGAAGWLAAGGLGVVAGLGPRMVGGGRRLASRFLAFA
jgi:hypothetical protein